MTLIRIFLATVLLTVFGGRLPAATVLWTNAAGGNWGTVANWSPNQVPTAADTVFITNNGTYAVTLNASATCGSLTLGGASGAQALSNNAVILTLTNSSVIGSNGTLVLASTLNGAGNLTVNGKLIWNGGTMSGGSSTVIAAGGQLIVAGVTTKVLSARTLVNGGDSAWSSGNINFQSGGVLSNAPSGTFDVAFDAATTASGGGPISNAGLFRKTGGVGAANINIPFSNTGTVEVQSGTLSFKSGCTNTGAFTTLAGATLDLSTSTPAIMSGSSVVSGDGYFSISSGTVNWSGGLVTSVTNNFLGGTANFAGPFVISNGLMNVSGGTVNFNSGGIVAPTVLNFLSGTLGGTNNISISAPFLWMGGTISGPNSNVVMTVTNTIIGAANKTLSARTLLNTGTVNWTNSFLNVSSAGIFSNAPSGTVDVSFDVAIALLSGGGTFLNGGTMRKSGGSGVASSSIPFVNSGLFEIQSGTWQQGAGLNYIQTSGETRLNGGGFSISGVAMQLRGGVLTGDGLLTGIVSNSASVNPGLSTGQLYITSTYTQTTNGILNIELAGPPTSTNNYDRLVVTNTTTLAGTLNITFTNGYYPAPNAYFTNVLITTTRVGTFNTVSYPSNRLGLQINYGPTNFDIQIINTPPNLPPIANQTIDEQTTLSFNVNATDADTPVQILTYALTNSPVNASINSSGLLTWTPTEAQGPCVTNITVMVTDNGTPNLTTNVSFQVTVREINVGPSLIISNQVVDEGSTLTTNFTIIDADIPTNYFGFVKLSGPPGLVVSPSGAITWSPTELDGPSTNTVVISMTDTNPLAANAISLTTTGTFQVIVREVNQAPQIFVPGTQTITEQTLLTVTNTATDADLPTNALTFALVSGPAGVVVNPSTGVLTWTPSEGQGPSTNTISVRVTDSSPFAVNSTALSTTNSFTVFVNESNRPPVLTLPSNQNINELVAYANTAGATDPDSPANPRAFDLISGPTGMVVNASSGAINWTPSEFQGATTNVIQIRVTDTNTAAINATSLSVTGSFTLTVREINVAPVVTVPGTQTLTELTALTVTNTATDADFPANPLTFALVSGPTGIVVDANSGVLTWTPSEFQAPSTNIIQVSVTDTNPGAFNSTSLSTTNSFTVIVNESNSPPTLILPGNQSINEMASFSNNATATDPDLPTNILTFALVSGPTGLVVNASSGAITWTPSEFQGPSTNVVQIRVTDANPPAINATSLSVTSSFTLTVNEVNVPPALTLPTNATINVLTLYTNNATTTDADLPANPLTFGLVSGPAGMVVSANGGISWTPSAVQGPSTNVIQISVTDTNPIAVNSTSLSVTSSFTLTVIVQNVAPVMGPLNNQAVNPGQTVNFTATATDADVPTNTLTFSLINPPAGANIAANGLFTWRLPIALANTTNLVRVRVTDDGIPNLSDTNSFTVVVNPLVPVTLTPLGYFNGQFQASVTGPVGPDYVLQGGTTPASFSDIATNTPVTMPFTFTNAVSTSNGFYRVRLSP